MWRPAEPAGSQVQTPAYGQCGGWSRPQPSHTTPIRERSKSVITDERSDALMAVARAAAQFVEAYDHDSWEYEEMRYVLEMARRLWVS